ncbi:MAG: phage tail sheath subtilisin-like domain-containing protein [Elainella sp. Prado103]|jgi:hypothetical protein|nr:phage tail sheath subtilisin-like domain-containing protein [Elainella sp. Prado103]
MPTYATPGVYIEEVTGPGVIAGVGTSTVAFIGAALNGPINEAKRITSFDEFLDPIKGYGVLKDGNPWIYITSPRWFYMAHAVRGFFENGGTQAYIVRIGTAKATTWEVKNQGNEIVFKLQAIQAGTAGDNITVQVQAAHATGTAGVAVVKGSATVSAINGLTVTVDDASPFRVGDTVTEDESARATITGIQGNILTLSNAIANLAANNPLRIANILNNQTTFRVASTTGLSAGTVVLIQGKSSANGNPNLEQYAVIQSVDRANFVTLFASPPRTPTGIFDLTVTQAPVLISQEFKLLVTSPAGSGSAESFDQLSLNPLHPNYVFSAVQSQWLKVVPPAAPAATPTFPNALVNTVGNLTIAINGVDDNPGNLSATEYEAGLNVLRDVDDVNILCIPDAVTQSDYQTIQQNMINHCLLMRDRFAILDSRVGAPPAGSGSVEEQRSFVQAEDGFAALYYPWLLVRDPTSTGSQARTMLIPPSGHMAGVYARADQERGVHKAPANTDVRGVLGLETRLSDRQQAPLNLKGVNVLRIFPGSGQVTVWGARTTIDPNITDWLYVPVRRLMIYIEQSIEVSIRWAVFEPNDLTLWKNLKRTISDFLTRVWRDGGLFGATADQAFYVRIDEALNPPSTRALGRLYIEIGVAPVRPAEFIIVRIGLWDGGSEVSES